MSTRQHSRKTARQNSATHSRKSKYQYRRTLRYESLEDRRLLAVVTVTTLADTIDFNDGLTSLREAIFATNTVAGADTIDFKSSLTAGGSATLLLTQGELRISDDLTISGPGANLLTIDASGNDPTPGQKNRDGSRVFNIDDRNSVSRREVALVGVTLTGGDVTGGGGAITSSEDLNLVDCVVTGNSAAGGGGVYMGSFSISGRNLTITRSMIQNNSATGRGGGVYSATTAGNITIDGSQFVGNIAGGDAGGLYAQFIGAVVTNSVFSSNRASGTGGGMTLSGVTTIQGTSILDNYAGLTGGGVFAGKLAISNSIIRGNSANMGPGVTTNGGGGVSAGSFVITATTISGNSSQSLGGGVFGLGASVITDCLITDNSAVFSGGGFYLGLGNLTIINCAIRGNSAARGGGIASDGSLVVADSAISGNFANGYSTIPGSGGGIWSDGSNLLVTGTTISGNSSKYDGGGVWAGSKATVKIVNSTVSGNSANNGGGVWITKVATISHSTVTGNVAQLLGGGVFVQTGTLQLQNLIVAGNSAAAGRDATGLIGAMIVATYSLIGWNGESGLAEAPVGSSDANGNLIGGSVHGAIDPMVGPLAYNGGPVFADDSKLFTRALVPGSPAINAGDPASAAGVNGTPVNDQRGGPFTRVYGGRIDIGAFEFQPMGGVVGDFNRDGVVDAGDYVIGRKQSGSTVVPAAGADANGDGNVNSADLVVWRSNFGAVQVVAPAIAVQQVSMPESTTVSLGASNRVALPLYASLKEAAEVPSSSSRSGVGFAAGIASVTNEKMPKVILRRSSPDNDVARVDLVIEAWLATRASADGQHSTEAPSSKSNPANCASATSKRWESFDVVVDDALAQL